jgi:hypothetical protein
MYMLGYILAMKNTNSEAHPSTLSCRTLSDFNSFKGSLGFSAFQWLGVSQE